MQRPQICLISHMFDYKIWKWWKLGRFVIHTTLTWADSQKERWDQYHLPGRFSFLSLSLFINCWIQWVSIGSFSVSCYTTIELQPRCHPSFLMGTGYRGAALLPWQQAFSHSPHIAWSMHVVPSKAECATAETGLLSDRTETGFYASDATGSLNPTAHAHSHFPLSLSVIHVFFLVVSL